MAIASCGTNGSAGLGCPVKLLLLGAGTHHREYLRFETLVHLALATNCASVSATVSA